MIYIFIVLFLLFNIFSKKRRNSEIFLKITMILFTLISAFRSYNVGTDSRMYIGEFFKVEEILFSDIGTLRLEKGYITLYKIIDIFTNNYQWVFIVTSIIINYSMYKFIKKYSENYAFSSLLYFSLNIYFAYMCIIRQGIALAIILLGFDYIINKKYLTFLLLCLFASLFHTSAIIMIILIPLRMLNFKATLNNVLLISVCGSVISILISKPIFMIFANLLTDYNKYIGHSIYFEKSLITAPLYTIFNFILLIMPFIIFKKEKMEAILKENRDINFIVLILCVATIISAASINISILSRLFYYLNIFNIIYVTNLIEKSKNKIVYQIIIIVITLCYVGVITNMGWYGVNDYTFCWEVPKLIR